MKDNIMNITPEFRKQFLTNTDETGRFIVYSQRTGRQYFVEPVMKRDTPRDGEWGSINPGQKDLMHKKGDGKYTGAVTEAESIVTLDNGFSKVHDCEPGLSPHAKIEWIDKQYPDKVA